MLSYDVGLEQIEPTQTMVVLYVTAGYQKQQILITSKAFKSNGINVKSAVSEKATIPNWRAWISFNCLYSIDIKKCNTINQ